MSPSTIEIIEQSQVVEITEVPTPTVEVVETSTTTIELVAPGPQGAQGLQGPQGIPGPPGADGTGTGTEYDALFMFASPSTLWTIHHDQTTFALNVTVFDQTGDLIEGEVDYVDLNTITVSFYYPTAGAVRIFS